MLRGPYFRKLPLGVMEPHAGQRLCSSQSANESSAWKLRGPLRTVKTLQSIPKEGCFVHEAAVPAACFYPSRHREPKHQGGRALRNKQEPPPPVLEGSGFPQAALHRGHILWSFRRVASPVFCSSFRTPGCGLRRSGWRMAWSHRTSAGSSAPPSCFFEACRKRSIFPDIPGMALEESARTGSKWSQMFRPGQVK